MVASAEAPKLCMRAAATTTTQQKPKSTTSTTAMEVRRAADALLRPRTSPLATLLAPTAAVRTSARVQLSCRRSFNASFRRNISTTAQRNALRPSVTTSANPSAASSTEDQSQGKPKISILSSPTDKSSRENASIEDMASNLWSVPKAHPRGFNPPKSTSSSPSAASSMLFPTRATASDILSSIREKPSSYSNTRSPIDVAKMLDSNPSSPFSNNGSSNNNNFPSLRSNNPSLLSTLNSIQPVKPPPRPLLTLNPSTGRSVQVGPTGVDVATGFMMVNISCTRNGVKRDVFRQRFHERPGLKRKRLKQVRYRKRFMAGFKATCKKVKEMSRMGW